CERLPPERRAHQPEKRLRIVAFLQPELLDLAILRQEPRPEHQVPYDDRVPVVGVRFPRHARVMPAVGLGAADDVVQRTVANVDVAVLEEAVRRVGDVVESEDLFVHPKQQEGQTVEGHLQRLLDRVEASGIEPVELLDRMMDGMQAPECVVLVREPVQPVAQQVDGQHHENRLDPDWPSVRPEARHWQVERADRLDQQVDEQKTDQRRQRELYRRHEHQVRPDLRRGRSPGRPVRERELENRYGGRREEHRKVGARNQRDPLRLQPRKHREHCNHDERIVDPGKQPLHALHYRDAFPDTVWTWQYPYTSRYVANTK